jgi:hypothetical protein
MKTIIFLIGLLSVVSCQTSKMVVNPPVVQKQIVCDTTYISEQDALGYWLLSQSQQVRDDFKKDFTFSGKQVKEFVDTLKTIKQ